jgi:hypothetical protein
MTKPPKAMPRLTPGSQVKSRWEPMRLTLVGSVKDVVRAGPKMSGNVDSDGGNFKCCKNPPSNN